MLHTGKITKIVNDNGIQYGFVKVSKIGDVFFSLQTQFQETKFESLNVNDKVKVSIVETDRGLFGESLSIRNK